MTTSFLSEEQLRQQIRVRLEQARLPVVAYPSPIEGPAVRAS